MKHLRELLSGRFQTLSTGRVLSAMFAVFALIVLSLVVHRMLGITDPALLTAWNGTLGTLGGVLLGLVGVPYSATKLTGSLSDIIAAIKKRSD